MIIASFLFLTTAGNSPEKPGPCAELGNVKDNDTIHHPNQEGWREKQGYKVPIPAYSELSSVASLPDPFKLVDGIKVKSRKDWNRRRTEIAALAQKYEYGRKPFTDYSATKGSIKGDTLSVTVNHTNGEITFKCQILYPESGTGPFPAMIGIERSFLHNEKLQKMGAAVINFPNNRIAQQKTPFKRQRKILWLVRLRSFRRCINGMVMRG